jgi:pilus assembly protein CpaE
LGIIVNAKEVSPDLILRSMRAGAHEFLTRPLDMGELSEAMERLASAMTPSASAPSMGGKIFTLFSAKGGTGVTSAATNLAMAFAKRGAKTVLVDLDLQFGDAALMLDLKPSHTWAEVLRGSAIDAAKLKTLLASHESGLWLLASPTSLDDADKLTAVQVGEVCRYSRACSST